MNETLPVPKRVAALVADQLTRVKVLAGSGVVRPYSPLTLAKMGRALLHWGVGPAGGYAALAVRNPNGVGLVDELGSLTYLELEQRATALADSLRRLGVTADDGVAVMVRNHRGFVDASLAASKLGADVLFLNTAFSGTQLAEVLEREGPTVLVYDAEFTELLDKVDPDVKHILAWTDGEDHHEDEPTLERLITDGSATTRLTPPERKSRIVILTSGTTGTPKGAPRDAGIDAAVSMLSRIPLRRDFSPERFLETVTEHRCEAVVVIPVMMQRVLRLPQETLDAHDLRATVEVVAASGSALPGDLANRWMDQFGDTLYNTYGSTEVAYATIATPQDLREAPGTAGKPPHGTVVRIYGEDHQPVRDGGTGRIFVGSKDLFEGYTGGGGKTMVDGLMSTGDVGRLDEAGRLFVEGRDDEMIVSGGENVFPKEVEDCLSRHDAVHEAAAVGVDDEEFGKRLRAFVVLEDGHQATDDELKAHVRSNLARYKVPREVVFLDELPRNATGKLLKRELEKIQPATRREGAPA